MKTTSSSFLYLNSIYQAHEGEGQFIGIPQFFVRLQGCSVGCLNCDSKDTWAFNRGGEHLSALEVLNRLKTLNPALKRVSITGGDPTDERFEESLLVLLKLLKQEGYWINIEASGTRLSFPLFDAVDWISLDLKTPSTGVQGNFEILSQSCEKFANKLQIKSVVADEKDFTYVAGALAKLKEKIQAVPTWILTPCYEESELGLSELFQERVQAIYQWNYSNGSQFRVVGQQHKWIFGPAQKQV